MNLESQQAIVVGAGLAGAAAARALAQRGWHVQVLEMRSSVAHGGSGVPVGVLSSHVSLDDNPLSQLTRQGLQWTRRFAQAHLEEGVDWRGQGVLERRITPEGADKKAWEQPAPDSVWHDHVHPASAALLSQTGLADASTPSVWHTQGAWIKPTALVHALLKHDHIEVVTRAEVESLQRLASGEWQLRVKNHISIPNMGSSHTYSTETAPHVVLALGAHTPDFLNQVLYVDHMGLHPIAGLVSWGLQQPQHVFPPFPVNGHGSFVAGVPTQAGTAWYSGATFERNAMMAQVTPTAHAENQQRLARLLPAVAAQLQDLFAQGEGLQAWQGVRCASVNRIPKVGPLDEAQFPGLYILAGMGSRGLTLSLLCADVLAALMDNSKPPVSESLLKAMRCQLV